MKSHLSQIIAGQGHQKWFFVVVNQKEEVAGLVGTCHSLPSSIVPLYVTLPCSRVSFVLDLLASLWCMFL
jgi:hypothetical protein